MRADDLSQGSSPSILWLEEPPLAPLERSVPEWRTVVMDAYARQPTLSLTHAQGQRLWGVDAPTCRYVLDSLVNAGLLLRTTAGQYCRVDYLRPVDPAFAM